MTTKAEISKKISELRDHGYMVLNFQRHRSNLSAKGMTDYLIVGNGRLIFVEAKLKSTKDSLRPKQIELFEKLEDVLLGSKKVFYHVIDENTVHEFVRNQMYHTYTQGTWNVDKEVT